MPRLGYLLLAFQVAAPLDASAAATEFELRAASSSEGTLRSAPAPHDAPPARAPLQSADSEAGYCEQDGGRLQGPAATTGPRALVAERPAGWGGLSIDSPRRMRITAELGACSPRGPPTS